MAQFLTEELGLLAFDPCVEEQALLSDEERRDLRQWKKTDLEKFRHIIRRFVDNDVTTLTQQTRFVICLWDEYAGRGAGTAGELTLAYVRRLPVYLVATAPLDRVPAWVLACATEIFDSFEALETRLRSLYASPAVRACEVSPPQR